jgi:5-methyltetrahydrofolate--homocysteine methyltransferase
MMGVSPADAAASALEAGADIIGSNCGCGMEHMVHIVREMKTSFPEAFILVHANAGLPANVDGRDVFPETPEITASYVRQLIAAGANIVGGCCGTTPAHIAAIRAEVDACSSS